MMFIPKEERCYFHHPASVIYEFCSVMVYSIMLADANYHGIVDSSFDTLSYGNYMEMSYCLDHDDFVRGDHSSRPCHPMDSDLPNDVFDTTPDGYPGWE